MDPNLLNNIKDILSVVNVKNQIKDYINGKDVSLGSVIYPPSVKDIEDICNKIEVIPSMNEMDPSSGCFTVDWNLFIYGTQRLYLGTTSHESINELDHPEPTEFSLKNSKCEQTWDDLLNFVVDRLQKYADADTISYKPTAKQPVGGLPTYNPNYEMNKSVGKQI